jgi:hypothetical protein
MKITKVTLYQIQFGGMAVLVLNDLEAWTVMSRTTFERSFEQDARALLDGEWYPSADNGQTLMPMADFWAAEPMLVATAIAGQDTVIEPGCEVSQRDSSLLTAAGHYLLG